MTALEIIKDFKDGKLKNGDTFDYVTNNKDCNPHIVRLEVTCSGSSLTNRWIGFDGRLIRNNWSIFRNSIQDDKDFQETR
jgi:hypothetical protein